MRRASPGSRVLPLLAVVAVIAAASGLVVQSSGALRQLELDSVDARFAIRGDQHPRPDVMTVLIDDATIDALNQQLGVRFPFPRRVYGRLIDRLRAAGARVIVMDLVFSERTNLADDDALIAAIGQAENVVLAANGDILGGPAVVAAAHARAGFQQLPTDRGGVIRRDFRSAGALPSLAVATAARLTNRPTPVHPGTFWIDYPGPAGTVRSVSFFDAYNGRVPAGTFRGRVVIVGASAKDLQDLHATSTGSSDLMPGPEIQADAVSTVLRRFPLGESPPIVGTLLVLLMAGLPAIVNVRLPAGPAIGAALLGGALVAVGTQLAFDGGTIVPLISPLLTLAVAAVGSLVVSYVDQVYARRELRLLFGRFVPRAVVDEVLAETGPGLRLGGVRRTVTVMFSDLRGFTSFAEGREPEQVIEVLNRYLTLMSGAILAHGGTLVAYMGDGLMAVFGAPLEYPDHADRAVAAAREMLDRLGEFNVQLRSEGISEPFRMGIGLNSGPVMAGNVGSEERLEYTALGDTTNTASRLEGMTKASGHDVFLAASTVAALEAPTHDLVRVGEFEIRGRQSTVEVWSLP